MAAASNPTIAKALPKVYGDRLEATMETTVAHQALGEDGQPVDLLHLAQRLAFVLSTATTRLDEKAQPGATRH